MSEVCQAILIRKLVPEASQQMPSGRGDDYGLDLNLRSVKAEPGKAWLNKN